MKKISKKKTKSAPTTLAAFYDRRKPALRAAAKRLKEAIRECIGSIEDKTLVRVELRGARIKTLASVEEKAKKHGWAREDALWMCSDLVGCRVICNNVEDAYRFAELLKESLPLTHDRIEVQDQIARPNAAGYRALHLNFRIDVGRHSFSPDLVPCEIQVRSRLQDAWAELSHDDIYKGNGLAEDLRARLHDLAVTLAAADAIASGIRQRVATLVTPPKRRPNLSRVTANGLAYLFSRTFGRNPPDYLVRQARSLARALNLTSLASVAGMLENHAFREHVSAAYAELMPVRISTEEMFLTNIRASARGEEWALAEVSRIAREEWDEIDRSGRREALSSLPETIDEFIDQIEAYDGGGSISEWSSALDTTSHCIVCSNDIIDAQAFAEAAIAHYEADEQLAERIESAVIRSEVDTGGWGDSSLCTYHDEQAGKDD